MISGSSICNDVDDDALLHICHHWDADVRQYRLWSGDRDWSAQQLPEHFPSQDHALPMRNWRGLARHHDVRSGRAPLRPWRPQVELHQVWRALHDGPGEAVRLASDIHLFHHLHLPVFVHYVEHCCGRHHWQLWLPHPRFLHPWFPPSVGVCHHLVRIWSRRRVS